MFHFILFWITVVCIVGFYSIIIVWLTKKRWKEN